MSAAFGWPPLLAALRDVAPAEARFFGDVAWLTAIGCVLYVAWSIHQHHRERALLSSLFGREPAAWTLPETTAVGDALAGWVQAEQVLCALSPDAAWQHLTLRVHAFHEQRSACARFLAYVPLMLGLAGTLVGLAHLLPGLDPHAGTKGLGPSLAAAASPGRHLEGVFYGTLSGVGASLLAGIAGLCLARSAARAVSGAEHFLRQTVLPRLPERRVTVNVEEAVLRLVSERAAEAVSGFRDALAPLAAELGQHARESTAAAEKAGAAFDLTAAVVRRAGNLEKAADRLVRGIQAIDTTTDSLGDVVASLAANAQQHAQIVNAAHAGVGTLTGATRALVVSVNDWHQATLAALQHQEQHGALLTQETNRLHEQIQGVSNAFADLADSVAQRNQLEDDKLHAAKDDLGQVVETVRDGFEATTRIARELSGVREAMETVTSALVQDVGKGLRAEVSGLLLEIQRTLTALAGEIPRGSAEAKAAGQALLRDLEEARRELPVLTAGVGRLHEEVAGLSQALREVLAHPSISVSTGRDEDPASAALAAELRNVHSALASLVARLAHVPSTASSTSTRPPIAPQSKSTWRDWWRRLRTGRARRPGGPTP